MLSLSLLMAATPAVAQYRVPEPQTYRFVSEFGNAAGVWVNPGASGFFKATLLTGHITFDRPGERWGMGQYLIGFQWGPAGFGYEHDEFDDPDGFAQSDNYTVSLGMAGRGNGLGVSRTWRTVGDAQGSWNVGYSFVSESGVSFGLVYRDIGSSVVRDTTLDARIVAAVTFREKWTEKFSLSLQGDYRTSAGDFRAIRAGATLKLLDAVELLAAAQWNGDGDFDGFRVGLYLKGKSMMATGVAGMQSDGDVRTGNLGLSFIGPRRTGR